MRLAFVIILWFEAAICACVAGVYAISGSTMVDDPTKLLVVQAKAILLGFMPWLIAYAGTRILYSFPLDLFAAWRLCCGGGREAE